MGHNTYTCICTLSWFGKVEWNMLSVNSVTSLISSQIRGCSSVMTPPSPKPLPPPPPPPGVPGRFADEEEEEEYDDEDEVSDWECEEDDGRGAPLQ